MDALVFYGDLGSELTGAMVLRETARPYATVLYTEFALGPDLTRGWLYPTLVYPRDENEDLLSLTLADRLERRGLEQLRGTWPPPQGPPAPGQGRQDP